jgi:hypothetical protein
MGIFQYLRRLMGLGTEIAEDHVATAVEEKPASKPAAKPAAPAKKPGRPAKAYQKKAKPVGGKKL